VKAYIALDRFRAEANFRPWLMTIVANEARNRRRSSARRIGLAAQAADRALTAAVGPVDPEFSAIVATDVDLVLRALSELGDADRSVIACRYLAELSEVETANVLGCRPGTVKSRTSRALARLREQLAPGEEPTSGEERR
jgi:RNA polymerase sigma factor (sigma-70 family)